MSLKSLFFCFWKHTGACIIIAVYIFSQPVLAALLTVYIQQYKSFLPTPLTTISGPLIVFHIIQKSMFSVIYWVVFNIPALLFSFRMQDIEKREKRYKRIVFWCLFVFLILGSLGRAANRVSEGL